MRLAERQRRLDQTLLQFRALWHPQPFRELRPAWAEQDHGLAEEVLALSDEATIHLNYDTGAALELLAKYRPEIGEIASLAAVPRSQSQPLPGLDAFWDWEIPGRKRAQIEAFAAAAERQGQPVLDWCGGKGHLGRLLALAWKVPVHSLDFDATLCEEGEALARRAGIKHCFVHADALQVEAWPQAGQHAVALHACGELHRRLIRRGAQRGVPGLDVAPCCYYRGVDEYYEPMSGPLQLQLSRDDTRLAVTETVTAKPREARLRDQALAWKLGFDAYRRQVTGLGYRTFKPVPDRWLRASFGEFMRHMVEREGLPAFPGASSAEFERAGWQRQREVMRYSIVRHAFRRALETWLVLDAAVYLEKSGYSVTLSRFCERRLTPRNLLISARLA
ncbi:methyltransferase [Azonexus sp. IMCC34839]|uniref:methyltransferase n=1 Tax=Azonexus sp. IMCC34839 TaxID=3133695 RepID=UPI00399BDD4D